MKWKLCNNLTYQYGKEKILKPWKGALSSHSVCLGVNGLQGTPSEPNFGLNDPWALRKKNVVFVFRNVHFYTFYRHFFFFFLFITLVTTSHCFSRNVIGLREPCNIKNWSLFIYFFILMSFVMVKWVIFPDFFDNFSKGGNFSKFSINFHRTYERGVVDIDIHSFRSNSAWALALRLDDMTK